MLELVEGYNAAVQILFPKYPWFLYPGHLIYAVYQRYMKYYKGKFRIVPMPNLLYELLLKDEFIKSEHIVFATQETFDKYAESHDVNFVNLIISTGKSTNATTQNENDSSVGGSSELVIKQILNQAPHTLVAQIRAVANCQPNCLYVQVSLTLTHHINILKFWKHHEFALCWYESVKNS